MTPDQEAHLKHISDTFVKLLDAKYRAGQKEHGGNLWDRNCAKEAISEAVDAFTYALTQADNIEKALAMIKEWDESGSRDFTHAVAILLEIERILKGNQ